MHLVEWKQSPVQVYKEGDQFNIQISVINEDPFNQNISETELQPVQHLNWGKTEFYFVWLGYGNH